ncbi:hypothetical protein ABPG74_022261 [Tetrahymena malaccensis]
MKFIEYLKNLDIFSESIQFNASKQHLRKKTVAGTLLTILIVFTTMLYFIYQSCLYFSGQMEPKFRQQSFVSDNVEIQLNNEMFGFDYFAAYQEQIFSSPFSYQIVSQAYPLDQITKTRGIKSLCQVLLIADESVNYFSIQFPIYTEVLAICNSSLALLLLFGIFCRKLAQNFIRRDILFILMKNFFSGTYLNLLQHNNLSNNTNQTVEVNLIQDENIQEKQIEEGEEVKKDILLPCLTPNSSQRVFLQLLSNPKISTEQDYIQEDFESEAKKAEKYIDSLRVTEKKEISLQINQDKKIDVKNSTNIINENEIIQKQFKNVSKQSQQFYQNNNSNNKQRMRGSTSYTHQSVLQKFDQSNQEHEIINFKNSCSQINKCFQNLNDKSLQLKLEQIFSKTVEIEQKVDDSLDFYAFYKDILLLKKAIMVILNKEQFAALQVIGIDLETINKSQDKIKLDNQEVEKQANHFQQQYEILHSKELQLQYINQFLKRSLNSRQNLDIIDMRILSSLLINQN